MVKYTNCREPGEFGDGVTVSRKDEIRRIVEDAFAEDESTEFDDGNSLVLRQAGDMEVFAWSGGKCGVPMWMGGSPAGRCGEMSFGPQYPREVLIDKNPRYALDRPAYCPPGPCCAQHGGPGKGEPIVFQDGLTDRGRPMYCAVMPDFINLQESEAGFDGDGRVAIRKLRAAISLATGAK